MMRTSVAVAFALAIAAAWPAIAGPPYATDDPEPTEPGHWEVYAFGDATWLKGANEGEAGFDINYGAAPDLQLTLVLPAAFEDEGTTHAGAEDIEVAAKWRFLRQGHGAPDVALFPAITVPTGDRRFGERRPTLFLPLWVQKDFAEWSVFGGGGYRVRPGRNVWETGLAITRAVGERLSLGGEVFHETRAEPRGRPYTGLNAGFAYRVSERWSLLASGGPGLQNRREGRFNLYVALKADY